MKFGLILLSLVTIFPIAQAQFSQTESSEFEAVEAVDSEKGEAFEIQREPVRDHRKPKGDLVVKAINIQNVLTDDVSGSRAQMVTITVQNIGNRQVQASSNEIQMNGPHYMTSVYGPANGIPNSYNLGAPIGPGQLGLLSFYLPLNTLRHCQKVTGVIDTRHAIQFGPYEEVFYNDSLATVFVVDKSSIRACVGPIIIR